MPHERGYNRAVVESGTLYLVATPIGNLADLTLRARRILAQVDAVICEQRRVGSTLLHQLQLDKPLVEWNEHSNPADAEPLIERLKQGEQLALISDHGTPLVQDPGAELVRAAIAAGISIEPLPGPSAVLAALVASGLPSARFYFVGQLPAKKEARRAALDRWRTAYETLILLDAPYRLKPLLSALQEAFGGDRRAVVACSLTTPQEESVRGTLADLVAHFAAAPFKGEYVVVVAGAQSDRSVRRQA